VHINWRRWAALLLAIFLSTGCREASSQTDAGRPLGSHGKNIPRFGEWGESVAGLRARIRISQTQLQEGQSLGVSLEVRNDSPNQSVRFDASPEAMTRRGLVWSVGDGLRFADSGESETAPESTESALLRPRQSLVIGPVWLPIVPSVVPRTPAQRVTASFLADIGSADAPRVVAPPVEVLIIPATWGPSDRGLRLCVASGDSPIATTQPLKLTLFLHNTSTQRIALPALDWSNPRIALEDDRVTLTYAPAASGTDASQQPPRVVRRRDLSIEHLFDRPGVYRVRVGIDASDARAPTTNAASATLWNGAPVSNEIVIRVELPTDGPTAAAEGARANRGRSAN